MLHTPLGQYRQLEYDFILAPGANPEAIELRFQGSKELALNSNGDLSVRLADGGEVLHHAPVIYQERDGSREKVNGKFVLKGTDAIGFELASYDRNRAVNIDPGLVFSTYLGGFPGIAADGSSGDQGNAIAVDSHGNVYVTGNAASANFPATVGQTTNLGAGAGTVTAYVTKLNATGSAPLVYSTFLGGNGNDQGNGIAVDSVSGDVYVAGRTDSITNAGCTSAGNPAGCCTGAGTGTCIAFPTTAHVVQPANAGGDDIFVAKLNATGSTLLYSTLVGGSGDDKGGDLPSIPPATRT